MTSRFWRCSSGRSLDWAARTVCASVPSSERWGSTKSGCEPRAAFRKWKNVLRLPEFPSSLRVRSFHLKLSRGSMKNCLKHAFALPKFSIGLAVEWDRFIWNCQEAQRKIVWSTHLLQRFVSQRSLRSSSGIAGHSGELWEVDMLFRIKKVTVEYYFHSKLVNSAS